MPLDFVHPAHPIVTHGVAIYEMATTFGHGSCEVVHATLPSSTTYEMHNVELRPEAEASNMHPRRSVC